MMRNCALLVLVAFSAAQAQAQEQKQKQTDAPRLPPGLFLGDSWRYQRPSSVWHWVKGFAQRTGADFISIPSNLDTWDGADLLTLVLTTAVSVGAAVPASGRSLDARILDEIHRVRGPNCDYRVANSQVCQPPAPSGFRVWNKVSNTVIVTTTLAVPMLALLGGVLGDQPELVEAGTLAIEAFAVSQLIHLQLKLFTGREGPLWGDGAGNFYGPSTAYFPDGWPSGHAATFFSIAAVYATYFEQPWLRVLLLGTATFLATMLVIDDAHYASDVLLGGVIGAAVGKWVVHHRSSRFRYGKEGLPIRLTAVAPLSLGAQGIGLGARFAF